MQIEMLSNEDLNNHLSCLLLDECPLPSQYAVTNYSRLAVTHSKIWKPRDWNSGPDECTIYTSTPGPAWQDEIVDCK